MYWQDILKRRVDIRNEKEYEAASLEDRRKWHNSQYHAYKKRLGVLRRNEVTNEDSPMYKDMVKFQGLSNFHSRQAKRLKNLIKGMDSIPDYYSKELEVNRRFTKKRNTPQGNSMPYQELSQEVYETLTDNEKSSYHMGMSRIVDNEERIFHFRMRARINENSQQPTFASSEHGGEPSQGLSYSKEQYDNMTDREKFNYHAMMNRRLKRKGDTNYKWHSRMQMRVQRKSKLPTFYSQEEEGEQ